MIDSLYSHYIFAHGLIVARCPMPTLIEAWLAEQTSERFPWSHPPTSDDALDLRSGVGRRVSPLVRRPCRIDDRSARDDARQD